MTNEILLSEELYGRIEYGSDLQEGYDYFAEDYNQFDDEYQANQYYQDGFHVYETQDLIEYEQANFLLEMEKNGDAYAINPDFIGADDYYTDKFYNKDLVNKYYVTRYGRVYKLNMRTKELEEINTVSQNGYIHVGLYGVNIYAHRLVALYFVEPGRENQNCVNHIDSDRTNNNAENLEWVTHKENIHHAIEKGRFKDRVGKPKKFTDEQAKEIKKRYEDEDISVNKLAKEYNANHGVITRIVKNQYTKGAN